MKTIWKYPLAITDSQEIRVPAGALALSVQMQGDIPCLWVLVDPTADRDLWRITTVGTGHPVPPATSNTEE